MSLRYGILGLLNYKPMNGYDLKRVFDKSISHIWMANLSQIYRELQALEKLEYVLSRIEEQDDRPDKKIYSITEKGKKAFIEWLKEPPKSFFSPKRDEFMLKIIFGSNMEKDDVRNLFKSFINEIQNYLSTSLNIAAKEYNFSIEFLKNLKDNQSNESTTMNETLFWKFTIKRAIGTLHEVSKWAKECLEELDNANL